MALGEFDVIRRFFGQPALNFTRPQLVLGPGDDAAILSVPPGHQLVMSMDTLNEDVHFPSGCDAFLLAQRCLLVNLSDLAAMGAEPLAFTLAISLPERRDEWLAAFSGGLADVAQAYQCPLIGGDTTRGPLSVTIQVHGLVPEGKAVLRSGARVGDGIYVTGELGNAAAALWFLKSDPRLNTSRLNSSDVQFFNSAFYLPTAQIAAGIALRGLASAGLDISDGLVSDLGHLLTAGACDGAGQSIGAVLEADNIPLSEPFLRCVSEQHQLQLALSGGDDYQLCVCVPPGHQAAAQQVMSAAGVRFTRIGQVVAASGIRLRTAEGDQPVSWQGYNHFA